MDVPLEWTTQYQIYSFDDKYAGPCIGIRHRKCGCNVDGGYWDMTLGDLLLRIGNHHATCQTPDYSDAT